MEIIRESTSDIVIIGGGLTGTVAAFELAKAGREVTLIRDGRGASPHVAGLNIVGADDRDSVDCYIRDTVESAGGQADIGLVEILCNGSAALPKYLESIGFALDTDQDGKPAARKSLGSSFARVVGKGNCSGAEILCIVDRELQKRENVRIVENARALRLFQKNGCISGVLLYEREADAFSVIRTPCVLIASGGYAGIFPFTSNPKDLSGDSVAMALLVGAHATDMEFVQFEPTCAVYPDSIRGKGVITTLFYEGAVLTNACGERFMLRYSKDAERVNKDVLSRCIAKELREGRGTARGGVRFDARGVDRQRMLHAYAPFVERYRAAGIDFLSEPVEVANAAHTSLGGIKVDHRCETNIKGLYAAGEALGNLHGANRIGGSAGTETLVFSRYVADVILHRQIKKDPIADCSAEAARLLSRRGGVPLPSARMKEIDTALSDILNKYLGVEREAVGLTRAVTELENLYEEAKEASFGAENRDLFGKLALENKLLTALALARSALLRDDSVGCHFRLDREEPPADRYRTDICIENHILYAKKIH